MADFQALLKRNPTLSREEFIEHWLTKHAPLVVPYFLAGGLTFYAQVHGPLTAGTGVLDSKLKVGDWDGAAELVQGSSVEEPQWKKDYYREVILVDERRFLISKALDHVCIVGVEAVAGNRRVIIQDGKSVIKVPEEVMSVWREYEGRRDVREALGVA